MNENSLKLTLKDYDKVLESLTVQDDAEHSEYLRLVKAILTDGIARGYYDAANDLIGMMLAFEYGKFAHMYPDLLTKEVITANENYSQKFWSDELMPFMHTDTRVIYVMSVHVHGAYADYGVVDGLFQYFHNEEFRDYHVVTEVLKGYSLQKVRDMGYKAYPTKDGYIARRLGTGRWM